MILFADLTRMYFPQLVLVTLLAAAVLAEEQQEEAGDLNKKITKLQIGVKKRVPAAECTKKSRNGDTMHMHYTGTLLADGSKFDSSLDRGKPFTFPLGAGRVIKGWDQGLLGMCEGEKRKLVIPAHLGYGARGSPPKIPADSALVFEVELLKIERKEEL